jgi:hypothetical protein
LQVRIYSDGRANVSPHRPNEFKPASFAGSADGDGQFHNGPLVVMDKSYL